MILHHSYEVTLNKPSQNAISEIAFLDLNVLLYRLGYILKYVKVFLTCECAGQQCKHAQVN